MIKFDFSVEEKVQLSNLSAHHPHPFVRKKAMALYLKCNNLPHFLIANILDISENTLRNYLKNYKEKSIESITNIPFNQPQSELLQFNDVILKYINETPPSTIKQACSEIFKLTQVQIGETQMRKYLKSIGVNFRKVAGIPAKVDVEKQKEFHDNILQPKLQEAKAGFREVYFMDAAHFVLGAFLGYLWSLTRIFVRTPSGRKRFNVLGALNAISKRLITITNDTYITSVQVCELLHKISIQAKLPITIILDNARYQHCKLVIECAAKLNIELIFLPPYSPNLNLIERMWKFVKKNSLNSKYYEDFKKFRDSISSIIDHAHETHQAELKSLLSLNFQLFDKKEIKKAG